jgi:hypothetical protein
MRRRDVITGLTAAAGVAAAQTTGTTVPQNKVFYLPGSRTELQINPFFNLNAAVQLLQTLQRDQSAQNIANQRPDSVLQAIGVSVQGGVGNLRVTDLFGGGLRPVNSPGTGLPPAPQPVGFIIIIIIIILILIPLTAS